MQSLPPCLVQLQLAIPAGCLTAIVGEVGSGKSSLLAALLGELELVSGAARLPNHQQQQQQQQQRRRQQQRQQQHATRVGYVGQVPWVMRGSVRDNVLMGQPCDAEFMGEVGFVVLEYNMLLLLEITCDSCWTCLSGALGDERKCERQRADEATL
jgi:ABC-type transport system involved in cytochrome bd biosynthesis fused ATPase/permease subunit